MQTDHLSDDTRCVAAAWFPNKNKLVFNLVNSKPSCRAQAGLDELVNSGFVAMRKEGTAVAYYCTHDLSECRRWFMQNKDRPDLNFDLLEPVSGKPTA